MSHVAFDLGAESGRVILGIFREDRLEIHEVHRFANPSLQLGGSRRWNLPLILHELERGLLRAAETSPEPVRSLSADSWGVDYVLSTEQEPILGLPFQYRDARNHEAAQRFQDLGTPREWFELTGTGFMEINTLFQLATHQQSDPSLLAQARQFLNIADFVNYAFGGAPCAERSLASTTQMLNSRTGSWHQELCQRFGIPTHLLPTVVAEGTDLGPLAPHLRHQHPHLAETRIKATCSHDTAAAVAAVPTSMDRPWAFLSSGTWSLLGVERNEPIINDAAYQAGFTNELGAGGTVRFLKNLVGLFVLQECRRQWASEGQDLDYATLTQLAAQETPLQRWVQLDDLRFSRPGNMPQVIQDVLREKGQPPANSKGQVVRCILDSLALAYAQAFEALTQVTGQRPEILHLVGGGSQNAVLNQAVADALQIPVEAGPVEATAIGNLCLQAAIFTSEDASRRRQHIRHSFATQRFEPTYAPRWREVLSQL